MKKALLVMMAIIIVIYACNKEDDKGTTVATTGISTDSTQLLSDSIKLLHYKTTTYTSLPASNSSAIVLTDKKDTVTAINGGYAIIIPAFQQGAANGYHVQIKGADTYFTTDLNQPMYRKRPTGKTGLPAIAERYSADSVIAIRLPVSLMAGTFTVQYQAYDSLSNISNTATAIVKVLTNDHATADFALLQGKWSITEYLMTNNEGDSTITMMDYGYDSSYMSYSCNAQNKLYIDPKGTPYIYSRSKTDESSFNFDVNNRFSTHDVFYNKMLDLDSSTCDIHYFDVSNYDYYNRGGYYYNATNKQLIVIYDYDGKGYASYPIDVYTITALTPNKMEIVESLNGAKMKMFFTKL